MNIVVINGTQIKGCTYQIKETFLKPLREGNMITEFYLPKDLQSFCCGCKNCFLQSTDNCPHVNQVEPIWNAMLQSDLLVFSTPVYSLGITGALKVLLDHLCVRWMVHRPEPAMFSKPAVVLSNCIGPGFMARAAQKDIVTSLSWLGVSKIKRCGVGLMEGIIWHELSKKRRDRIENKVDRLARTFINISPNGRSLKVRLKFFMCKKLHQATANKEETLSADNQHWLEHGWISK